MTALEASTPLTRHQTLCRHFTETVERALEIGPLASPALTARDRVRYVDYCNSEELLRKYKGNPDITRRIVDVDIIWAGGPIKDEFRDYAPVDLILASHVIEHVPNLIMWIRQLTSLLTERGVISLAVPDKRFTFDYLRAPSSLGDVIDAYQMNLERPSLRHVIDQRRYAVRYRGANFWADGVPEDALEIAFPSSAVVQGFVERWQKGDYIDTHCWVFTPASFIKMMDELRGLGLIDVAPTAAPVRFGHEFIVHLARD